MEWEESGDIRILNNKEIPTRKPDVATHKANCIDIMAISKGLERKHSDYQLDTEHEWSPATVQTKYNGNLNTEVYLRGKSTDHKAQKVTLHVDLIDNGNKGNRAVIDYNNSEGWKKYYNVSDRYAGHNYKNKQEQKMICSSLEELNFFIYENDHKIKTFSFQNNVANQKKTLKLGQPPNFF